MLLIGDAAHQMPPFAGQGMCSGLRDADNLAWKLGAVLNRDAPDTILASLQREREPQVRKITEMAIAAGRIVCTTDHQIAAQRDLEAAERASRNEPVPAMPIPPLGSSTMLRSDPDSGSVFPQFISATRRRSDDVLGPGPWLICSGGLPETKGSVACYRANDVPLEQFGTAFSDWLRERGAEAVLVRPDRIVFGSGAPAMLISDWNRALANSETAGASA